MLALEEALQKILQQKCDWGSETILLHDALRRVLAEDIIADRDYPPFNRSTMDGYAVRTEDITNHISQFAIVGEIFAGDNSSIHLNPGEAVKIMTGAAVPESADAVIKKEDAEPSGKKVVFRVEKFNRYQHIALQGEDCKKDDVAVKKNVRINVGLLSVLASLGTYKVRVSKNPTVSILSTGNEIQPIDIPISAHQIRDSNNYSISGFLQHYSIAPIEKKIVPDDRESLVSAIRSALKSNILILTGGVSAGDADLVPAALKQCGVEEVFHNVKIKPGKPVWFGYHPNGARIFALPGNPFSVQVAWKIFIEPFLRASFSIPEIQPFSLPLYRKREKKTPFDEYFPVKLCTEKPLQVDPHLHHSSGDITAMMLSDGIVHHPSETGDLVKGENVNFIPW